MTVLKAEDMHCENCVTRINKALGAEGMKYSINLENKTVSVDGNEAEVEKAREILDDLGFETVVQ
ncbi:MAG TPA: heavy-metal-associated domain-containing protein [Candidatus Merdenecus merdavium]|nr:heavy-metal-associated domain-containing protein [Candidatus Merdenecus merdavium]